MSVATTSAERKGTIGPAPFSLKDAPSFIEAEFPVGRLSAEAYKERKAGAGQTLTALGSYWKGRKPLILVRAVVLGSLLPTTNNTAADLDIFLKLMAMDDAAFLVRLPLRDHEVAQMAIDSGSLTHDDLPTYFRIRDKFLEAIGRDTPVEQDWIDALAARALVFDTDEESKRMLRLLALGTLTYEEKVPCLSGCHPQPLAVVFGHAHGHSPAWQSSVPTIAPRVPATFSRRRGLRRLPGEGSLERRVCLPPLSAEEYLPIIHLVFANLKTWLNGIHHGVSHQHLQAYLNEFTFRFNKRFYPFNAFRSLLGIAGDVTAPHLRRALLRSLAASYM